MKWPLISHTQILLPVSTAAQWRHRILCWPALKTGECRSFFTKKPWISRLVRPPVAAPSTSSRQELLQYGSECIAATSSDDHKFLLHDSITEHAPAFSSYCCDEAHFRSSSSSMYIVNRKATIECRFDVIFMLAAACYLTFCLLHGYAENSRFLASSQLSLRISWFATSSSSAPRVENFDKINKNNKEKHNTNNFGLLYGPNTTYRWLCHKRKEFFSWFTSFTKLLKVLHRWVVVRC